MVAKDALTDRQQKFVEEYLVDFNASRSALAAGYAESGAHVEGCRLLKNPKVRKAIDAGQERDAAALQITREWVLERLRLEASGELEDSSAGARIKATELLGKHLGMFTEKHQIESVGPSPVIQFLPATRRASDDDSDC